MNDARPTLDDLRRIVDILQSAEHCSAFRFQQGDFLIEVDRDGLHAPADGGLPAVDAGVDPAPVAAAVAVGADAVPTIVNVTAPSVGFLRCGQAPEKSRAVGAGDRICAGDILAAIDVLGDLVPVTAPTDGRVVGMLVEDGAAVGYGQALVLLQTD